jgi:hypothetical protein
VRKTVALIVFLALALAGSSFAGQLGRKVADSGPQSSGRANAAPRIYGHKRVTVRGISDPPFQITGTWSTNCFLRGETIYHREAGLPSGDGVLVKHLQLPSKKYDYCVVASGIVRAGDEGSGTVRVQVFVRPRKRGR